jgi:hypothetical protein
MDANQKLMAFWKSFDGVVEIVLCGEISGFVSGGKVKIKEYGNQIFLPIRILPYEEGLELKNEISTTYKKYKIEKENVCKRFLKKMKELAL